MNKIIILTVIMSIFTVSCAEKPSNLNSGNNDLEISAQNGDVTSQFYLGMNYSKGENNYPIDDEKAFYWLKKAADQGDSSAQNNIAIMYLKGEGVQKSRENAKKYFLLCAYQNIDNCLVQTGLILINEGGEKNKKEGIEWLRKSILSQDTYAYYNLGRILVRENDENLQKEGVMWLEKSMLDFSEAQFELYKYYLSKGDKEKSNYWLKQAAIHNNSNAKNILRGQGVE